MSDNDRWYRSITKDIGLLKDELNLGDYLDYRIYLLRRMVNLIAQSSSDCRECQLYKEDITRLIEDLRNVSALTKELHKNYFNTVNKILGHLKRTHNRKEIE